MSYCEPVCTVPCGVGYGVGGGVGSCGLVPVYGGGSLSGVGGGLGGGLSRLGGGLGDGPAVCTAAAPSSEVIVQPPSLQVFLPGPILSSFGGVGVAQFNPCSGYGYPALGSAGSISGGSSLGGRLGLGGGYCGSYGLGGVRRYSRKRWFSGSCGPC